jgi:hypothetical protein
MEIGGVAAEVLIRRRKSGAFPHIERQSREEPFSAVHCFCVKFALFTPIN